MQTFRRKTFDTVVRAEGERRLRFVISDGSVDREGDTIDPRGWDLRAYRRNPVVLWAHDRSALPVAKAVEVDVVGKRLMATAEFATHAFAEEVYRLYRDGFMRATSVGFKPIRWQENRQRGGYDFLEQELVEFSCVPVPANANALVAASVRGVGMKELRAWARGILARNDGNGEDAELRRALNAVAFYLEGFPDLAARVSEADRRRIGRGLVADVRSAAGGARHLRSFDLLWRHVPDEIVVIDDSQDVVILPDVEDDVVYLY